MRIFWKKLLKSPQRRRLCPRTPVGLWGLIPQTLTLLLPATVTALCQSESSAERVFYDRKRTNVTSADVL